MTKKKSKWTLFKENLPAIKSIIEIIKIIFSFYPGNTQPTGDIFSFVLGEKAYVGNLERMYHFSF